MGAKQSKTHHYFYDCDIILSHEQQSVLVVVAVVGQMENDDYHQEDDQDRPAWRHISIYKGFFGGADKEGSAGCGVSPPLGP